MRCPPKTKTLKTIMKASLNGRPDCEPIGASEWASNAFNADSAIQCINADNIIIILGFSTFNQKFCMIELLSDEPVLLRNALLDSEVCTPDRLRNPSERLKGNSPSRTLYPQDPEKHNLEYAKLSRSVCRSVSWQTSLGYRLFASVLLGRSCFKAGRNGCSLS